MRGTQLFNQIFDEQTTAAPKQKKGRDTELHARRNQAIADRWYYYGIIKRLQYQKAVEDVAADFFLSPFTIPEIITQQFGYIQSLRRDQVTVKDLQKKWSHLRWD